MKMMSVKTAAAACVLAAGSTAIAHPYGWRVGQTASGDLTIDFLWDRAHHLNDSIPGLAGVADHDLAFEEFPVDNPPINLFTLDPGGKIDLVIDQMDPAVYLRDDLDVSVGLHNAGDRLAIGASGTGFRKNPWWHLDTSSPEYTNQGMWSARFHLTDSSGLHGDSPTYTFLMVVPAPGTTAAVGVLGLMACRRRR